MRLKTFVLGLVLMGLTAFSAHGQGFTATVTLPAA